MKTILNLNKHIDMLTVHKSASNFSILTPSYCSVTLDNIVTWIIQIVIVKPSVFSEIKLIALFDSNS